MKFYSDFNAMFNAQSGLKADLSVFNEDYKIFPSQEGGPDAGQVVFEMDNADDPTKIDVYYVPMDWKLGDSLDNTQYYKYSKYGKWYEDWDYSKADAPFNVEYANYYDSWRIVSIDGDYLNGYVISPERYDVGGGYFNSGFEGQPDLDADTFCRKMAEEPGWVFFAYDWRGRNIAEDCKAKAVKYLTEIFYKKNKKAMAEYLANK